MLAQCAARSSLLCLQCKVWACALDLDFLALVLSRHTCVCAQGKGSRSVNSFCPLVPLTNVPNNICALNQVHVGHRIVNKYFFPFEVIFKILVIKGGDEVINVKLSIRKSADWGKLPSLVLTSSPSFNILSLEVQINTR